MGCRITLITGPLTVYWAPLGEAFPDVTTEPSGNWSKIGTLGARDYAEEGVTVASDLETNDINSAESIDPECVTLTGRDMRISFMLQDFSTDQLRVAFGFNPVTNEAGPPDVNKLSLDIDDLTAVALILRGEGKSPDFEGGDMQFEFENVIEVGSKEIVFNKEGAAMAALEFRALAGTKTFVAQNA